jgi:phage-related protein
VRDWLTDPRQVQPEDKKTIGEDIKAVQFGWPMGMPIVRKLEPGLWEVRSDVTVGIARVLFTILKTRMIMVLLHGFIKKEHKTPQEDLELARQRMLLVQRGEK